MKTRISEKATALGFDTVGFCAPELPPHAAQGLNDFILGGHHGDMLWMSEKADRRADPKTLWPDVQSIIVLGHNYGPETNPLEKLAQKNIGNISCYAQNRDYHDVIKKKLKEFARWVTQEFACEVKVFVDTAPVMEKTLAAQAGLGWQGKHTCLVSREFGSWLFLGSVFTTLSLAPLQTHLYEPSARQRRAQNRSVASLHEDSSTTVTTQSSIEMGLDKCGSCRACLDICPTQAFTAERQLDARRCISYLTIEHKGQIAPEFRKAIGNRIYGCDDCLAVCPWNKFAQTSKETAYHPRKELEAPLLAELVQLGDEQFRSYFSKSPVKRIGRDRFVRNVLIAIGNSEDASLIPVIAPLQNDNSPLVAEMATWAISEITGDRQQVTD
jgi:epoxyqueuosine reductase